MSEETTAKRITPETAQKIDFLIEGVEEGKFDEVAQKIEFMKKLGGEHTPPSYLQDLLVDIQTLQFQYSQQRTLTSELEQQYINLQTEHEALKNSIQTDMTRIAKALQYLFKPDPLNNSYELNEIDNFISDKGARKY